MVVSSMIPATLKVQFLLFTIFSSQLTVKKKRLNLSVNNRGLQTTYHGGDVSVCVAGAGDGMVVSPPVDVRGEHAGHRIQRGDIRHRTPLK